MTILIYLTGARSADGIVSEALSAAKRVASDRLSGKAGSSDKSKQSGGSGSSNDVIELTDSNFESLVINTDDMWLVEFFAPW